MSNLFLFTGEESYLLNEKIKAWKDAFLAKHGELNLEVLDAKKTPINEIMAAVTAMPFLGDKRLIFIHGLPEKPKTRNKDKVSKADEKRDEQLKKLAKDLDQIPETSVVIFVQSQPDKRKSFYKSLIKKAEVKEFNPLAGSSLIQWVQNRLQSSGGSIGYSAAEHLVSLTGPSLWRLSSEIDKLAQHSPGKNIAKELIDNLVVPSIEANIFHLTDALAVKDGKKAIANLHKSMAAGENLRQVFYMIIRQFRLFLQGVSFLNEAPNPSPTVFSAKLKIHPFVAKNTLAQSRHFNIKELKKAYADLLEIDTGLKTSQIKVWADNQDELALAIEKFIVEFTK